MAKAKLVTSGSFTADTTPGPERIEIPSQTTQFEAFIVVCTPNEAGWTAACANFYWTTAQLRFGAPFKIAGAATELQQAVVPFENRTGEANYVDVYWQGTASSVDYYVYCLTSNPGVQMRSDGRAYPIGSHTSWTAVGTSTDTNALVPAPPSPLRVLIQSVQCSVVSWTGTGETALKITSITVTVNGSGEGLLIVPAAHGGVSNVLAPEGGVLCDIATEVELHARTTERHPFGYACATYDLVV